MKVFQVDVRIVATAYIVAETEQEARALIESELTDTGIEVSSEHTGGFIRGCRFATLLREVAEEPDLPRVTISPAITIVGPVEDYVLDESE